MLPNGSDCFTTFYVHLPNRMSRGTTSDADLRAAMVFPIQCILSHDSYPSAHSDRLRGAQAVVLSNDGSEVDASGAMAAWLRASAAVLHSGRQLATAEGRIKGADGKLYAHASTTCLVFEQR
jgi:hypothetical protein